MFSKRATSVDASGIRKVFALAKQLKNPTNLSIGQPNFEPLEEVQLAAKKAIANGKNGYLPTTGLPALQRKLVDSYLNRSDVSSEQAIDCIVTGGVSGGLFLSFLAFCDPGDEILIPDPFFVIYRDLAKFLNITPVCYDTAADFHLAADEIEKKISPKTKAIIVNTPNNPTGIVYGKRELDEIEVIARKYSIALIYDEIYSSFVYEGEHLSCASSYEKTIVLNGFSKSAGIAGWRLGYLLASPEIVSVMASLQQFSFVCGNSVAQHAALASLDADYSTILADYKIRRDFICDALADVYDFERPGGAFYLYPKAPGGDSAAFFKRCLAEELLIVPGTAFSRKNSHFRISFSASMETLERGVEILRKLAK